MNTSIIIAIITGVISIGTAIVSYLQARKIESLKKDLEIQNEKANQIFKFFFSFETDKINQELFYLKEYLSLIQRSKDQIRDLIDENKYRIRQESEEKLHAIQHQISDQYSKSVYYFNRNDFEKHAHALKNLFKDVVKIALDKNEAVRLNEMLHEISFKQKQLQSGVENEIKKTLNSLYTL